MFLQVLLPGSWWHGLVYETEEIVPAGVRVVVPVGRGARVGVSLGLSSDSVGASLAMKVEIKKISRILDDEPVLSDGYLRAAGIVSRAFLCSQAEVLRSLLPSSFWKDEKFPHFAEKTVMDWSGENAPRPEFFYRYSDAERQNFYREKILACEKGTLCIFPERDQAKNFYNSLVGIVPKERLILWPATSSVTSLKSWKSAIGQDAPVIIGGPGAAAAPLSSPGLFIVEDESNPAWRTKKYPFFSLRSFVASRATETCAQLVLGGRLPSSRVYKNFSPEEQKVPQEIKNSIRIIDISTASELSFRGLQFPLSLSDILTKETLARTAAGEIVFWLLDRRGAGSELRCADCGQVIQCVRCGAPMSYGGGKMRCPVCGLGAPIQERCPSCNGMMLQGAMPGLESLAPAAQSLLGQKPVFLWHLDNPATLTEGRRRIAALRRGGGLLLGSRRALSLLEILRPSLICWLDAGAEARRADYAARYGAFSMLLESCCRGDGERSVIFQTRRPHTPWLTSLHAGWGYFWKAELPERRALGFPPLASLVEIELPDGWDDAENLMHELQDAGYVVMYPSSAGRKLTILAPKISPLRKLLEKYFSISRSRVGFPSVQVRRD